VNTKTCLLFTFAGACALFGLSSFSAAQQTLPPMPVISQDRLAASTAQAATTDAAVQELVSFSQSELKFNIDQLMDILRDKRHEGWVLAAYPDPKTAQPLIGAGFSLGLPAREHPQRDSLNPRQFLEPSSADLWLAAGLPPEKLEGILTDFNAHLDSDGKKGFRRQIRSLDPQITEDDANALLRIGIIQAAYNAKAYCRNFDQLTASQQMAMTQLVYQMGVNLEQFSTFLGLINRDADPGTAYPHADRAYWHDVQMSLVQSQWARLYRERARAVIAMLDPRYELNPNGAEHSLNGVLRPARTRHARTAGVRKTSLAKHRAAPHKRRHG
jgi:hypothetical protein